MGIRDLFIKKKKVSRKKAKKKAPKPKKKAAKKKSVKAPKQSKKRVSKKKAVKKRSAPIKPVKINRNECPECGSANVVISEMTGNTICQDCGAIFAGLPPEVEQKIEEVKNQR